MSDLLCVARAVKLPGWATHVAVSKVRENDAEPCAWLEEAKDYVDEDPATLEKWVGSYKHAYWEFFSLEDLASTACRGKTAAVRMKLIILRNVLLNTSKQYRHI